METCRQLYDDVQAVESQVSLRSVSGVETCSHFYDVLLLLSLSKRSFGLVGKREIILILLKVPFSLEDSFMFKS